MTWYKLVLFFIPLVFFGCAPTQVVKTEYIKVPTYCNVTMPSRPDIKNKPKATYNEFMGNLQKLLIYTDELEMALLCCKGSEKCITK